MTDATSGTPIYLLPAYRSLGEPMLRFNPARPDERHVNPLEGLRQYGPYSRNILAGPLDPIRVAVIAPRGEARKALDIVAELAGPGDAMVGAPYRPNYPGFRSAFSLNVAPANDVVIELPATLDKEIAGPEPHRILADHLLRAIQTATTVRAKFDVLLIYLPDRWLAAEAAPDDAWFLHDQIKSLAARNGVSTQVVRDKALTYYCRASVLWHLGIALYVKAGGVPWKLAEPDEGTAFIGLGYALRRGERGARFVICCSQIFDSDGAGLEFLLYETGDAWFEGDDPFLSRKEMRRVIGRSIQLYQRRNLGRLPTRLVVHKTSIFKDEEIQGVFDEATSMSDVELVHVQARSPWRGINVPARDVIDPFPVERGDFLQLGGHAGLLWTSGNAPQAVGGRNFYKEGRAIPEPIEVVRFAGRSSLAETASDVLALTKMDWNNDALYDRMPVTTQYAKVLARVAKNFTSLSREPYPLRLFM